MPQSAQEVAKESGHTLGPTSRDISVASERRSAKAFQAALKTMPNAKSHADAKKQDHARFEKRYSKAKK